MALASILDVGAPVDVQLVTWPDQEARRARLAAAGLPCLLVVAADAPPPESWSELEDWIREPLDPHELDVRCRTLDERARLVAEQPQLDDDGLVWFGGRWVAVTAAQQPVLEVFLARLGRVVSNEEIAAAYGTTGGSVHVTALKAMVGRLAHRIAEIGLVLHNVRDVGYLLDGRPCPAAGSTMTVVRDVSQDT